MRYSCARVAEWRSPVTRGNSNPPDSAGSCFALAGSPDPMLSPPATRMPGAASPIYYYDYYYNHHCDINAGRNVYGRIFYTVHLFSARTGLGFYGQRPGIHPLPPHHLFIPAFQSVLMTGGPKRGFRYVCRYYPRSRVGAVMLCFRRRIRSALCSPLRKNDPAVPPDLSQRLSDLVLRTPRVNFRSGASHQQ